jgi:spore coat polysaccharide biosynthesis protein SpsF
MRRGHVSSQSHAGLGGRSQREADGVVGIIQARMTSTRLPGKVLADLEGQPMLAHMIGRLRRSSRIRRLIVATTTNSTDDPVDALCRSLGVEVFRGGEHDVLARFVGAARRADARNVARLTADCPMIDPALCDEVVTAFLSGTFDYVSNSVKRTYPDGLDIEVFTLEALLRADANARHPYQREHVTPYMYGMPAGHVPEPPNMFQVEFQADLSHLRWTLDTADDLVRIRALVARLPKEYTWLQALSVATREPWLLGVDGVAAPKPGV